jgi:hypothetical protein
VDFVEAIKIPDHLEKPRKTRTPRKMKIDAAPTPGFKLTPSRLRKAIAAA